MKNSKNHLEEDVKNLGWLTKEVLNFKEALALLGVSSSMLYKLTHQRAISHYKPNGKLIYFKKADLIEWMLNNKVCSVQEENVRLFNELEKRNYANSR